MNSFFYPKLALMNLQKNAKTYVPYLLTCIGTILMFYNMIFLVVVKDIGDLSDSRSLRSVLGFGAVVIAIFSVIFLFYTNSFLIKRRKKEFGLFNILGMEKKHIAKVMLFETLFIALISLGVGIPAGILFSKLMILLLFKIISFKVTFGFEIPPSAILMTLALFSGIFLVNLLYNVFQVHLSKPIELLKGGNVGEKEPKTRWIMTGVGVLSLGAGYYIALTTESPLQALTLFFVAVVLVMVGTYNLFTAGSIALLKMLRKNKSYYYKLEHFISVSGMMYRMKQNAVGLANICILSTAVIVMLSTTISLYVGVEDALRTRFPRNISMNAQFVSDEQVMALNQTIEQQTAMANVPPKNVVHYRSKEFTCSQEGNHFTPANSTSYSSNRFAMLVFIPLEDYNHMENKSVELAKDQVLVYSLRGNIPSDRMNINGYELTLKERLNSMFYEGEDTAVLANSYYIVVKDIETINQVSLALTGNEGYSKDPSDQGMLSYNYGFDVNGDKDTQIALTRSLQKELQTMGIKGYVNGAESSRASFYAVYGGLFFLGLFLGILFIMATVLIIYYKQIAEGYDDKGRYEIMQKVGMSLDEVKKSIRNQVLTVFFLPLVTAAIHIGFAFKLITRLLSVFNLTNIPLFALWTGITLLVFAAFYALVYAITARTYYKIVS
ncbi:ABC transporter permease [Desulfitobacterium metallireducens]|uniref:Cell division protein FtsX n=1 Tax=Desulfitobacterium metallireducens DSM 15288 TaxID=871968 RepID=W0E926_9FIRM|nr:ABC transporter permease [Desulfitobacterium metallireducens]AHF07247.1 cell division protein FtsX [Desulfitobacterium metallireducens DSM 15288]